MTPFCARTVFTLMGESYDILSDALLGGVHLRRLHLAAAFCIFSMISTAAENPFLGKWKLNTAKSKSTPGTMFKELTVVFESDGNGIKRTLTGIDADGQKIDMSDTIPWDGIEHKIDGPMGPAMVAAKRVNDHTLNLTVKVNGKVVSSGRAVVSKDGKTMTSSLKGEDPKGRKLDNVEVFERQ